MTVNVTSPTLSPNSQNHSEASHNISGEPGDASSSNNLVRKRPKPVSQWSVADVQKWLRKNCGDVYHLYSIKFLEQDITGRCPNCNKGGLTFTNVDTAFSIEVSVS